MSKLGDDGTPADEWPPHLGSESALPAGLAHVLDWLRGNLSEPVDLNRLADIAGVRPRTLEAHFKHFLGTSPLGCVRQMRLAKARRELERARPDARVTDIAPTSGFPQLGRFAAAYRTIYGELPSATLRQSRVSRSDATFGDTDDVLRLTWEAMPHVFAIAPRECGAALETLEHARRLAPRFGLPVALTAWCRGQRAAHGFSATPQEDRDSAVELVAATCRLAPNDALALTLASGALTLAHRLGDADRLLERALALDPWLPYAWVRRGWASVYMGDPDAAFRELEIALRLAPVGPMRQIAFIGMGCAHFATGSYGRAVRWVHSGTQAFPGAVWADRVSVAAAIHADAADEARRMARRLMRKDPHLTVAKARKAWPFPSAFMGRLGDGLARAGVPRS